MKRFRSGWSKKGHINMQGQKDHLGLKIALLCVALLLVAGAVYYFAVYRPRQQEKIPESVETKPFVDPASGVSSEGVQDWSNLQNEAAIRYNTINDPFLFEGDIVFSSTSTASGTVLYNRLVIYHTEQGASEEISVPVKYENIAWLQMSEQYIVWVDSSSNGGGRVCAYDRQKGEFFAIKDYVYALPQLSLDGQYLAFLQQAGQETDRLYLYDLQAREGVTVKVFEGVPETSGAVHLQDGILTYAVSYTEGDLLKSRVTLLSIETGQEHTYEWGRYIYAPKTSGRYTAFLSSATGPADDIYLSENGEAPLLIAEEVVNYRMGDGYLCYTKDGNIYLYEFGTGKTSQLNTSISRGMLASASGGEVCWYDVTSAGDVDVVKYAKVK